MEKLRIFVEFPRPRTQMEFRDENAFRSRGVKHGFASSRLFQGCEKPLSASAWEVTSECAHLKVENASRESTKARQLYVCMYPLGNRNSEESGPSLCESVKIAVSDANRDGTVENAWYSFVALLAHNRISFHLHNRMTFSGIGMTREIAVYLPRIQTTQSTLRCGKTDLRGISRGSLRSASFFSVLYSSFSLARGFNIYLKIK